MGNQELLECLARAELSFSEETTQRLEAFYALLVEENARQNLTRLISPVDFVEGHVIDCAELLRSGLCSFPAMDLGSGGGVPGLISAILQPDSWVLVDSERRKAEFLASASSSLALSHVRAKAGRAEEILRSEQVESVVVRAVGTVDKIFGWIRHCSTWNNLVLLKSRGWEAEWAAFSKTSAGKKLRQAAQHEYEVGAEKKYRVIVRLERA